MKFNWVLLTGLLLGLAAPAPAWANGATASFPAGGVVFSHNDDIAIEREDLTIGLQRVHVHYVFRSSAARPLRLTIGFPLAKVVLDDGPDALLLRSASKTNLRNYMAFEVRVNGKLVQSRLHEYASKDGADITAKLRALHVPVFAVFNGRDFGLQRLSRSTVGALLKAGLVRTYGEDPTLYPQWEYQSVYEWRQIFRPGGNEVDVSYTPLYGDETTDGNRLLFPGPGDARYCYDDAFKERFLALRKDNVYVEPLMLGYILRTARNWNGSIGLFNLKIADPDGYLFSFCVPGALKPAGDGLTWTARDFVPDSDLDIVFIFEDRE